MRNTEKIRQQQYRISMKNINWTRSQKSTGVHKIVSKRSHGIKIGGE
jgi:hypothetical protein